MQRLIRPKMITYDMEEYYKSHKNDIKNIIKKLDEKILNFKEIQGGVTKTQLESRRKTLTELVKVYDDG